MIHGYTRTIARCAAALALLAACGCKLLPGAEHIPVYQHRDSIQGGRWVAGESGTIDAASVKDLTIRAKNFTYKHGGDVALVNVTPVGPKTVQFTIDAWRTTPQP
jgi:hypothetical protein